MDVDATAEGIAVMSFKPLKPEDASHDRITAWCIRLKDFPRRLTRLEDGAMRRATTVPNFDVEIL